MDIVKMDKEVVLEALNLDFKDVEDALQYYSANESGEIKINLTRSIRDYRKSDLAILTPEIYLKSKGI